MSSSSTVLSLHGKGLKLDSAADVEPWIRDVDPSVIEEIHLGGNTIGVGAAEAIAAFLVKATALKVANFADIFTQRLISEIPLALGALCDALVDNTSLVEINLSDNAFGGRSVQPMVPLLSRNRSFQILKLNNNGLGPVGGLVIADALYESARLSKAESKVSNLHTVVCGKNRLENGSASAWSKAFSAHGTLKELRMPQNGIRMEGIAALAHGLKYCPSLETIDLQDNAFISAEGLDGIEAWNEALPCWKDLHTINFSDCVLSLEGEVPILIHTLASGSNPKLRILQLENNNLETQTFEILAQNISKGLSSLMRLELQWNDGEEDDEHLETLALSLKQRGGKLILQDDEEEEEEQEEEQEEEKWVRLEDEAEEVKEIKESKVDSSTDDLADLLGKVTIETA